MTAETFLIFGEAPVLMVAVVVDDVLSSKSRGSLKVAVDKLFNADLLGVVAESGRSSSLRSRSF